MDEEDVKPAFPRERQWWQSGPLAEFKEKVRAMSTADLQMIATEMKGILSVTQAQIQAGNGAEEWRKRAKMALGFISERKAFVTVELTRRNEAADGTKAKRKAERDARILVARSLLAKKDIEGALEIVLDLL